MRTLGIIVLAMAALLVAACGPSYSQSSPQKTLDSAHKMVVNGDARRLGTLLYADNPDTRRLMLGIGQVLGHLQELAQEIERKFPEDVQQIRARADEAAKNGEAASVLGRIMGEMSGKGRGRGRPQQPEREDQDRWEGYFKELFADPYGWLERNRDRLTTEDIDDDRAAILWDGKPVLMGIGMTMQKVDGRWFIVLPTHLPGLSQIMPKTPEQHTTFRYLLKTFDNAFIDLRKDVATGKASDLNNLSNVAGRKLFPPMMMCFIAYGNLMDEQRKEARRAAEKAKEVAKPAPTTGG